MASSPWPVRMERIKEILRYEGIHFLLWRMAVKCLSPLGPLALMNLYTRDLTESIEEVRPKVDMTIAQATECDIEQLVAVAKSRYLIGDPRAAFMDDITRRRIIDNFRRGQQCFIGRIGDQIVHFNWIFFQWMETITGTLRFIHLQEDEALLNDAYTLKEWRGRSIYTVVQRHMLLSLKEAGYRMAYTVVATNNKSSQKTHHLMGWRCSGKMLYFIARKTNRTKIWRISGTLDPFVETGIPKSSHILRPLDKS